MLDYFIFPFQPSRSLREVITAAERLVQAFKNEIDFAFLPATTLLSKYLESLK